MAVGRYGDRFCENVFISLERGCVNIRFPIAVIFQSLLLIFFKGSFAWFRFLLNLRYNDSPSWRMVPVNIASLALQVIMQFLPILFSAGMQAFAPTRVIPV